MSGALVIGVGPGIGTSVARAFAREGLPVGLLARSEATVETARQALADTGVPVHAGVADATDGPGLRSALDAYVEALGVPDVVVYNAALIRADSLDDLDTRSQLDAWSVNVVGAMTAAAHLLPQLAARGRGTFIVTGGMPVAVPDYLSLSLGKAGVRALVEALDVQFGPSGVHAATVTVGGAVAPGSPWDPDLVADHYVRLHAQPHHAWEREVFLSGAEDAA